MINNALLNDIFLNELFHQKERQIYAKITLLSQNEQAIESIEGKVTGGSINIDGDSAIRRSCSINLIASPDLNINEFYWGFKNKFKLEIGLSNDINIDYNDTIWFPQGIFLITNFDCNYTTKKYDINIKGKDKMCLLNGELGGIIPYNTDFGKEEYLDKETDTKISTDIPIYTIIQEMMKNFGNELPQNIIINNIQDAGLELLEYRGKSPMFLLRPINSDIFENITFNEKQECYYLDDSLNLKKTILGDSKNIIYDNLISLEGEIEPSKIVLTITKHKQLSEKDFYSGVYYKKYKKFFIDKNQKLYTNKQNKYFIDDNTIFERANIYEPKDVYYSVGDYYYLAKFDTGSVPGYKLTDLTYAGDLIANAGDSITSILDKIKNMLGDFEYFYNLEGKFVFQKRERYNSSNWYNAENDEIIYNDATLNMNKPIFSFLDNTLITAFKNSPKMENVKNDYSVWGTRKLDSGMEKQIHARYAIDIKPKFYKSYNGHFYITDESLIEDIQKNLNNTTIDKFTTMIEIPTVTEQEFKKNIYYRKNLSYLMSSNNLLFNQLENTSSQKWFAVLKNYIYDIEYDPNIIYYQSVENFIHVVDWREIIYQMALDYRQHYHDVDFLYNIAINNKNFYPTGITGYERYYTDMEGFWRDLYNPEPSPISDYAMAEDAIKYHEQDELYISNSFRKLNEKEKDQYIIDLNQLYILDYSNEVENEDIKNHLTPEITPFLGSQYCHLNYNNDQTKSSDIYFYPNQTGVMNDGTDNIEELNKVLLSNIYTKERGPFITLEQYNDETGAEERNYYYVKGRISPGKEIPEIDAGSRPSGDEEEQIDYNALKLFCAQNDIPFYGKDGQWILVQKTEITETPYMQQKTRNKTTNNSIYQYWVYKYKFGTKLGEFPDDYSNYVAKEFENYLNKYGWDKLYIRDNKPIKFTDLDQHIQRLYYKQAQTLTQFLQILQYDNFNQLKTNFTQLKAILPFININNYSSFDLFNAYMENILKEYIGEYTTEAKIKSEEIYKIKKLNNETEKEYLNRIKLAFENYLKWLQDIYPEEPYFIKELVQYQTIHYDYNIDSLNGNYWNKNITDTPEILDFWFDFINGETSFLSKYSIQTIGPRPKVINDTSVKAIYYKEVPNIIFITSQEEKEKYDIQTGYNYIQLPQEMQSIFTISTRGKSATDAIEDLIYQHCYASETASISTIPIYHLQPNTCIYIRNDNTNINGDYLISKISIPLDAKKQMNITATKVIPNIL